ncbi:tetratricopeptide repeat-containing sensor histidine kinase [Spirosoma rigui]|uniref:tetratricopeptide repeat-containing sensor histidine kinase n=1 Tax=Spirosoma rigui TaxID=564064 RepID=UPI0009B16F74|nr:tetratricopeptide repeat protein [Spirosoma rigui]
MNALYRGLLSFLLIALLQVARVQAQSPSRLIDSLKTTLARKLPDSTRANTYYDIANAFVKTSQYDSAQHYLDKMPPYCLRSNYYLGMGYYCRLNGIILNNRGQYNQALPFLHQSIDWFTRADRPKHVARAYNSLGLLYKMMGQQNQRVEPLLEQGIGYVRKSIAINQRLKAMDQLVDNYINLGIIYEDLRAYDRGRTYFLRALAINDSTHALPSAYPVIYNDLGANYIKQKDFAPAVEYLNKALAINLPQKRISSLIHNYRNLSTAHRGLGQLPLALDYAEKARQLLESSPYKSLAASVYSELARVHEAAGLYPKAYQFLSLQKGLEDSLMTLNKAQAIARVEEQYALQKTREVATLNAKLQLDRARELARIQAEKETEVAAIQAAERQQIARVKTAVSLQKARSLAEIEARYKTKERVHQITELNAQNQLQERLVQYMAAGLFVLTVLMGLLVYQYTAIRRANRRLSEQNTVISQNSRQLADQAQQLRTLMKELHHRVKNNLAIISGLLRLQANGLEDESVVQAVRVGQQRVEAMSLIHQGLYQTDQVTLVNMAEYLPTLAQNLMRAYGYGRDTFDLQMDIKLEELDVDVAIPLGLIVNELVTNAFKYAYNGDQVPLLRISLQQEVTTSAPPAIVLEIEDNGPGITPDAWRSRSSRTSFGKRLVTSLTEQLEGTLDLFVPKGTLFRLRIPQPVHT